MSYAEFLRWCQYRAKRGSLNVGRRVEQALAMLMAIYANSHSKNGGFTLYDFAVHEEEPEISLDQAMKDWC